MRSNVVKTLNTRLDLQQTSKRQVRWWIMCIPHWASTWKVEDGEMDDLNIAPGCPGSVKVFFRPWRLALIWVFLRCTSADLPSSKGSKKESR